MPINNAQTFAAINLVKTILLIGVVAIHSNTLNFTHSATESLIEISDLIRYPLSFCVPLFFIISGFLFFLNVDRFNSVVYRKKIKSRIVTLLIPYLLWNTAAGIIRFLKAKYLGYDGDGIYVNGEFSLIGLLCGYWDTGNTYPMLVPLWFIRNLIIFQILSPIFYFIARNKYLTLAVLLISVCDIDLYGGEFFLLGCVMGINKYNFNLNRLYCLALFPVVIIASYGILFINIPTVNFQPILCYVLIILIIPIAGLPVNKSHNIRNALNHNSHIIFFIYVIHGMYSNLITRFCASIIPANSLIGILSGSLISVILNISLSYVIFLLLNRISPRLIKLLTGSRSSTPNYLR